MGPPGEGEGARQRDSGATSGGHRAAAASRGRWLRFACVSGLVVGQCLAQSADERACSYFGQGATGRADKIVKDRCPSSRHGGFYYFTVDVLPGSGFGSILVGKVVSPADSCEQEFCDSGIQPGYDVFISSGCLPSRRGPGDALDGVPNTFNHTVKKISLSGAGRYYLALQLKPNVHEGDVQCSVALFPGTISPGTGASCIFADFSNSTAEGDTTVPFCEPWSPGIPFVQIVIAVLAGMVVSFVLFRYWKRRDARRKMQVACDDAEAGFRVQLANNAKTKSNQIRQAPIDVAAAAEYRVGDERYHHVAGVDASTYQGVRSYANRQEHEHVWRAKMHEFFKGNVNNEQDSRLVGDTMLGPTDGVRGQTSHTHVRSVHPDDGRGGHDGARAGKAGTKGGGGASAQGGGARVLHIASRRGSDVTTGRRGSDVTAGRRGSDVTASGAAVDAGWM